MVTIDVFGFSDSRFLVAQRIRQTVFIGEQGVTAEEEFDEFDATTTHFLLCQDEVPVGAGRVFKDGHLGRIAVLKSARGLGFGRLIVEAMVEFLIKSGVSTAILGSQIQAVGFYERLGFIPFGSPFVEAGILHQNMKKELL